MLAHHFVHVLHFGPAVYLDLPFSRDGSLSLADHGDDPVRAHIQGDVPEQRVAGCCRPKGHTFLDCRSAGKLKNEKVKNVASENRSGQTAGAIGG